MQRGNFNAKKQEQLVLLHDLLFRAEKMERATLEETIYRFGSLISEKDYMERELFVFWVTKLNSCQS